MITLILPYIIQYKDFGRLRRVTLQIRFHPIDLLFETSIQVTPNALLGGGISCESEGGKQL